VPATANNGHSGDSSTAGSPVLRLEGVRAGYGEVEVLHGISLEIPRGSVVAVLGPNGSGKSTLCSTIGGLLAAADGSIVYDGEDITRMSSHDRARNGLVVVPESRGIFPNVSVDENMQLWLPDASDRDEVYQRFTNLAQRKRLPAGNLSGGEQQMLSIGPMLVRPPTVLVVDEPTLGIAQIVSTEIMRNLEELAESGTTVILVEERARNVMTIAQLVTTLYRGRLLWFAGKDDVDDEVLASAYMGGSIVPDSVAHPAPSRFAT
jgi:ABC-type branched-subunit amino acid transport system ATPase component